MQTRAKPLGLADSRLAASIASNWRWLKPRVGDSGGLVVVGRSRPVSAPRHRRSGSALRRSRKSLRSGTMAPSGSRWMDGPCC
jgi:hypothetical protein